MASDNEVVWSPSVDALIAESTPEDTRPEWVKHPPADQVIHHQVPICDLDGSCLQMQSFNAAGERLR